MAEKRQPAKETRKKSKQAVRRPTVVLPEDTYQAIERLRDFHNLTRSKIVETIINRALAELDDWENEDIFK
jgi:hypothetical protein